MSNTAVVKWVQENITAKVIAKATGITICIAAIYYAMCVANPYLASGTFDFWGVIDLSSIRVALTLRPLVLITPLAAIGCMIGSYSFIVYQGKLLTGFYLIMPAMLAALGLGAHAVSKKFGRSFKKDIAVLTVLSFCTALITTFNVLSVGWIAKLGDVVLWVAVLDITKHMAITMAGYFLWVMPFEKVMKNLREGN